MKKTFTTVSILLFLFTCSLAQKPVTTYYDWNKIHPHEVYSVNSAGQKTGAYKEYDQNGVVIKEYNYLNGVENGLCIDYAATGNNQRVLAAKATFKSGQPEGYFVQNCRYTDFKQKLEEGQYKDGKKTGLWRQWWCDDDTRGVLKEVGYYNEGNQDGEWRTYSRAGVVLTIGSYRNGFMKNGVWSYYTEKGSLISRGSYVDDKENGLWSFYDLRDSTKVLSSGMYEAGNRIGKWRIYFDQDWKETKDPKYYAFYRELSFGSDGRPTADIVQDYYVTGELQWDGYIESMNPDVVRKGSIAHYYYKSGKVQTIVDYAKGIQKGYYEDGKLQSELEFTTNKGKAYYESGKLLRDETYKNGKVIAYVEYDETGDMIKALCPNVDQFEKPVVKNKSELLKSKLNMMAYFLADYKDDNKKFMFDVCESASQGFSKLISYVEWSERENNARLNSLMSTNIGQIKSIIDLYNQSDALNNTQVANQIKTALEKIMP